MKSKIIKIITIIAAVALIAAIVCVAVTCSNKRDDSSDSGQETEKMIIFENDKTSYTVVYPDDAAEAEKYAAEQIAEYFQKVTGAKIPVKQNRFVKYSEDARIISVGNTSALEKSGIEFDYDTLNGDGFFIKVAGKNVFINGATRRGALYGAYEFIEKYLGVKFLTYDETYIPEKDKIEIEKNASDVQIPSFRYRNFMTGGGSGNHEFLSKMRFVNEYLSVSEKYGGNIGWYRTKEVAANHNSLAYVPDSYAASNPEFFSMVNGSAAEICQTYGITEDGEIDENISLSPIKIAIESLKKYVKDSTPDTEYFMFSQMDTKKCCSCDRCLADAEKYKRSGINVRFVNILAREIQKWADEELGGRKIKVVTFAYQYSEDPPVNVNGKGEYEPIDKTVVCEDNVYIRLATYDCNNYFSYEDENQSSRYRTLFGAWSAVAKHFMAWDYHVDYYNYFSYYPTMQTWKENLALYKKIGVENLLMQSAQNENVGWQVNLETYVASKLMWNIDLDINELTNEFITYYYGIAADGVKRYKRAADLYYRALFDRFPEYTLTLGSDRSNARFYDLSFLESQIKIAEDEIEKVEASGLSDEEKASLVRKLKIVAAPSKFMIMYNYNSYYLNDQSGYTSCVDKTLSELSSLGFTRYSEGSLLSEYKMNHGIRD